jgi:hypothetical protein
MRPAISLDESAPRPSELIAEALVQRLDPSRIAKRAARLGFSPQLTHVMVVACGATALHPQEPEPPQVSSIAT